MTITAVLDTNVFVSAAISKQGAPGKLMALLEAEAYGVVMSSAILEEIAAVMRYHQDCDHLSPHRGLDS